MMSPEFVKEVHQHAKLLITPSQISHAYDQMAEAITRDLQDENPIFVCLMNGGLFATAELTKRLNFPLQIDYVQASRYGNNYQGDQLTWIKSPNINPQNRTVVICDDILDGGITLGESVRYFESLGAGRIITAVLLDKQVNRASNGLREAGYAGLTIGDYFVYGCGLDYHGYFRNVPAIYAVDPKHMI